MYKLIKIRLGFIIGICFMSSTLNAAPITYEGVIGTENNPLGHVSGTVNSFSWSENLAQLMDFWSFTVGPGGLTLDIWGTRQHPYLDPVFTLYSGVTSADDTDYLSNIDYGGMHIIAYADDQIPVDNGPYGDPALFGIYLPEGIYTIGLGGYYNGDFTYIDYGYDLYIGNPGDAPVTAVVPLLAPMWFMLSGLIVLVGIMKRKMC